MTITPDPTIDRQGSPNLIGPKLNVPLLGQKPTESKPAWFVASLVFAQFALFVGLLGPVVVTMALKVNTLTSDPAEQVKWVGGVLAPGALAAVFANAFFGRLSDRTTSRWGRRRPWMIGGVLVMVLALVIIALATGKGMLTLGWFLAQMGANAALSPYVATMADQLPDNQYGKVSGLVGMAQNIGIFGATAIGSALATNTLMMFLVPGIIAAIGVIIYALCLPEPVLKQNAYPFDAKTFFGSFWTSPFKFPDFGMVWWGRFFITLASFLFTTFRLAYMKQHLGFGADDAAAAAAVTTGVGIYTVVLIFSSVTAGWLSDRTGKRKMLVAFSTALFALGTYLLLHAGSVTHFYLIEALMGFAFGIYAAVDFALVLDVLPNAEDAGKDLGVFNMANALPQSLAPYLGGYLLGTLGGGTNFTWLFTVAGVVGLLGAVIVLPIKGAK
ncbi:MFS transporter [Luteococcus peritonei]|uniref:MFS transporter n=1 Tax=Luteococcus peritonei TaxID=88874 RepID=A0ABW4RXC5_9ACTN